MKGKKRRSDVQSSETIKTLRSCLSVAHTFTIFRFSFFLNQIEPRVIVVVRLTHERTHKIFFRFSAFKWKKKKAKDKLWERKNRYFSVGVNGF